jgi:hypothetical protein
VQISGISVSPVPVLTSGDALLTITSGILPNVITSGTIAPSALNNKGNWLQPTVEGRTLDVTSTGTVTVSAFSGSADTDVTTLMNTLDAVEARLPAALVDGRMDSSVGAMAANTLTASALATNAVEKIADGLLTRNVSNVESTAPEHSLTTIILANLENSITGTTLTIKRTDGTTTHVTKTLTTSPTGDKIVGIQ